MILDRNGLLSDAQAMPDGAATVSTNVYDTGTPQRDIGSGMVLAVSVSVDVAADFTTGNETYRFDVIQSAADTMSTPTIIASEIYIASGALISTLLVAGYSMVLPIPAGMPLQRYLALLVTTGGTTATITVTAHIGPWLATGVRPKLNAIGYTIVAG